MNPDDLARILDELGQRLGPSGEYVFELAVRQVVLESVATLVVSTLGLVVMFVMFLYAVSYTKRHIRANKEREAADRYYRDDHDYVFPWATFGIFAAFLAVILVVLVSTSIVTLLNPEYVALNNILGAIR